MAHKKIILKLLELAQELDKTDKAIECSMIVNDMEKLIDGYVTKQLILHSVSTRFSEAVDDIDSNGLECGIEDVGITDRYEAMQYGFDQCKERALEAIELASD